VNGNNGEFFSYERLKCKSNDPAPGIDPRKREVNISLRLKFRLYWLFEGKNYGVL
jgi:hypothetical protein